MTPLPPQLSTCSSITTHRQQEDWAPPQPLGPSPSHRRKHELWRTHTHCHLHHLNLIPRDPPWMPSKGQERSHRAATSSTNGRRTICAPASDHQRPRSLYERPPPPQRPRDDTVLRPTVGPIAGQHRPRVAHTQAQDHTQALSIMKTSISRTGKRESVRLHRRTHDALTLGAETG
jgi:hypothetical protein